MKRNRLKIQYAGETREKKKSWSNANEDTEAGMFVQATEDAQLRKDIQRCADRPKIKLKVIKKNRTAKFARKTEE